MARRDGKGISTGMFMGGFFGILFVLVMIIGLVMALSPEAEFTTTDVEFGTKVYADLVNAQPEYESTDGEIVCRCQFVNGTSLLVRFDDEMFENFFGVDPDEVDPNQTYQSEYRLRIHGDMRHSEPSSIFEGQSWIFCSSLEILRD